MALVSIPLSISLAVASGTSPMVGIITAVWAGFVAAIFGGSNFNIVGPAGALSGILAIYALEHGVSTLPMLAIVAGILTLLAWGLRLEKYLVFIPVSVVHGFTLGVAITIARSQISSIIVSPIAIIGFSLGLISLFALAKYFSKLPPAVVVAAIGIIVGWLGLGGLTTLGEKFPNLSVQLINWPVFQINSQIVLSGGVVALVAILETMLSAKIADGMTRTRHDARREMLGLGLANLVSGLVGGLPATAVLARTALNIKSGANHRTSAILNSILVAIISLLLFSYFRYIPMAVIASILVFVAARMVDPAHLKHLWEFDRWGFVLALVVAAITVIEDPMLGILVGTGVSLLVLLERLSHGQYELTLNHHKKGDIAVYSVKGELLHLNAHMHRERLEQELHGSKNVVLRLREVALLDMDGLDCLAQVVETLRNQGRKVVVTGVGESLANQLFSHPEFDQLKKHGLVFAKTTDALQYFGYKPS